MQRRCANPTCRRLLYDTEKVEELPDRLDCQHCGRVNVVRRPRPEPEPKKAAKKGRKASVR